MFKSDRSKRYGAPVTNHIVHFLLIITYLLHVILTLKFDTFSCRNEIVDFIKRDFNLTTS